MERDGYLTSESTGHGTKAKKIFSITDFGKQALLNWEDSLRRYGTHVSRIVRGIEEIRK
jgi:DNA-binding PadR family transcriptional regulator